MGMGSGLLALAMLAVEGPTGPSDEAIAFQFRVVTLDGLGWRSTAYPRLHPVARKGKTTVWTADRALAESLVGSALSVAAAPRCVVRGEVTISSKNQTHFVAAFNRVGDGPVNQASRVAFVPEIGRVDEGFQTRLSGRKLDQGVLAHVAIEDTHIRTINSVSLTEAVQKTTGSAAATPRTPAEIGVEVLQTVFNPGSHRSESKIACQVQVPEISEASVEGEWLIPNDGVLLVSLGVETVADEKGMAVVRERVAIVEVAEEPRPGPIQLTRLEESPMLAPPVHALASPPTPGRMLPEAIDPSGKLIDLPPLPEGLASTDLDRIKPDPNQPSPQSLVPGTIIDPQLARTAFVEKASVSSPASRGNVPQVSAPLISFCKKLIETMPEYRFGIDVECDGRTCKITVEDGPTGDEEPCPAEAAPAGPSTEKKACCLEDPECADAATSPDPRIAMFARMIEVLGNLSEGPMLPLELPKATYFHDDVQYLSPTPEPAPAGSQVAIQRARMRAFVGSAPAPAVGVTVKATDGSSEMVKEMNLNAALKNPGRTETLSVPLGGKLSLEIKARVVPVVAEASDDSSPR